MIRFGGIHTTKIQKNNPHWVTGATRLIPTFWECQDHFGSRSIVVSPAQEDQMERSLRDLHGLPPTLPGQEN